MRVSSRRSRVDVVAAGLLALLALVPEALAAPPPASFPAAGEIVGSTVVVRAAPRRDARKVAVLGAFRDDFRVRIVLAYAARHEVGARNRLWYRISVPGRPNGRTGWVPAGKVALEPIAKKIVVDRSARRLDLFDGERRLMRTRVAVGARGMETPLGRFYVTGRFTPRDPFFGSFALETSAYSRLSEWPGGGIVGIHGTNRPQLLGEAVSHGCVRVSNRAALQLKRQAPVGTPIEIIR
jgi:lipoprotein-anchoring transpeptidase ErfK/SrfK